MKNRILKYWQGKLNRTAMRNLLDDLTREEEAISQHQHPKFDPEGDEVDSPVPYDADELLTKIHSRIAAARRKHVRQLYPLYKWLGAAMVLIVLGAGWFWYRTVESPRSAALKLPPRFERSNTGDTAIRFFLPDGSAVLLSPGSRLGYRFDEAAHRRIVELTGKGLFKVFKDAENPFSVQSGGYVTTALGTKFSVDNTHKGRLVKVELFEGKVVVKNAEDNLFAIADTYLRPGEDLNIDLDRRLAAVSDRTRRQKNALSQVHSGPVRQAADKKQAPLQLDFNQEPLETVFQRVGKARGADIVYAPQDIAGLTFTGDLSRISNMDVLLTGICLTNQLQFRYENGKYIITKSD